jgi:hypothetical protein
MPEAQKKLADKSLGFCSQMLPTLRKRIEKKGF